MPLDPTQPPVVSYTWGDWSAARGLFATIAPSDCSYDEVWAVPSTTEINLPGIAVPLAAPEPANLKRRVALILGLALSVLVPVLAFRGVDLRESGRLMLASHLPALGIGASFFLATLFIRSLRWYHLVSAQQRVRARSCLSATCVGFLANNLLPFRLGDLVRAGALQQIDRVSGARVLATLAVERILDILTLVLFLGTYLLLAGGGAHCAELTTAGLVACGGGIFLAVLFVIGYRSRDWFARALAAPAAWLNPALGSKAAELAGRFLDGLHVFVSPLQVLKVVGLSLGLWGVALGSYYYIGRSQGLDVAFPDYAVVLFATAFGAILPAAPGAIGTFHGFARLGLFLVGVHNIEEALAFATVLYAVEWVTITLTGLYFLKCDSLRLSACAER
jgi:uncharacterized protein (TIRG00374 family)